MAATVIVCTLGIPVAQQADSTAIFFPPDDPDELTFEDILAMGPPKRRKPETTTVIASGTSTLTTVRLDSEHNYAGFSEIVGSILN